MLHSVLEFIREDFKHFERQAAGRSLGSAGVKQVRGYAHETSAFGDPFFPSPPLP